MGFAAVKGLHGGNTAGPSSYLPRGTIVSEAKVTMGDMDYIADCMGATWPP